MRLGGFFFGISMLIDDVYSMSLDFSAYKFSSLSRLLTWLLLKIIGVWSLVSLPVKQDPVVGGKPPRSPILSRRSYLSPIRGRRVGDCTHASVQEGRL